MRRIEGYRVATGWSAAEIQEQVKKSLDEGYEPVDSLSLVWVPTLKEEQYCQTLVKYSDGARLAEDYQIVIVTSFEEIEGSANFEDSVNKKIQDGYEPVGGATQLWLPLGEVFWFVQAVVKYR